MMQSCSLVSSTNSLNVVETHRLAQRKRKIYDADVTSFESEAIFKESVETETCQDSCVFLKCEHVLCVLILLREKTR